MTLYPNGGGVIEQLRCERTRARGRSCRGAVVGRGPVAGGLCRLAACVRARALAQLLDDDRRESTSWRSG
jgi:hypothetical protein